MTTQYTFGDSDIAARRLAMVSEIFDPPSEAFVRTWVDTPPTVAVDLGCGPGNTTALLSRASGAATVVGLDQSTAFVATARANHPRLEFAVHDVTETPFPTGPVDLIYARLVLAHLANPTAAIEAWRSQLRPGGVLLLDEVAFIHTDDPTLGWYESVVVGLVASRGADMYAGAHLPDATIIELPVDAQQAAAMYALNLQVWRDDPWVTTHVPNIDELAAALAAVPASASVT
ncbi:MAG: class I SAM-dependent methyltransferase, partial [Acidimicrobiales bacterium]